MVKAMNILKVAKIVNSSDQDKLKKSKLLLSRVNRHFLNGAAIEKAAT